MARIRINTQITADPLLTIDEQGKFLGKISRDQALYLAQDKGLDLVEVNPDAVPPVVKIIDYGKYLYEQQKKISKNKAKQKGGELKEIRLSIKINEHDFNVKVKKAIKFLNQKNKVKISLLLKGRENIYAEKGIAMINKFCEEAGGTKESEISKLGNKLSTVIIKK